MSDTTPDYLKSPEELEEERLQERKQFLRRLAGVFVVLFVGAFAAMFASSRDDEPLDDGHLRIELVENAEAQDRFLALADVDAKWPPSGRLEAQTVREMLDWEIPWDRAFADSLVGGREEALQSLDEIAEAGALQIPKALANSPRTNGAQAQLNNLIKLQRFVARHRADGGEPAVLLDACKTIRKIESLLYANPISSSGCLDAISKRNHLNAMALDLVYAKADRETMDAALKFLIANPPPVENADQLIRVSYAESATWLEAGEFSKIAAVSMGPDWYLFQPNKTKRLLIAAAEDALKQTPKMHAKRKFTSIAPGRYDTVVGRAKPNSTGVEMVRSFANFELTSKRYAHQQVVHRGLVLLFALRLHEIDKGSLPGALADLVPEYLEAVPVDPFDGRQFRYVESTGGVYSVGEDGTDSMGDFVHPWPSKQGLSVREPTFTMEPVNPARGSTSVIYGPP